MLNGFLLPAGSGKLPLEWAMFQWDGDPDGEFEEEQYQEVIDKYREEYEK
jgi:hypothetical protein